jgi:FlaA1/EpsC-like NDP-sugar epimerase
MVRRQVAKLSRLLLEQSSWFVEVFQALLILCSLVLSWLLRFDFNLPDRSVLFSAAPILVLIRLGALRLFNLHHGWWRYAGVSEALDIAKAVSLGSIGFVLVVRYLLGVTLFPRTIYLMEAILTAGMLAGVRLLSRAFAESVREELARSKKVLLIGAGLGAEMVLREIKRPGSGLAPIACVDDDRSKHGIKIHGVPVVGTIEELPSLAEQLLPDEVLIAVPSATKTQMQRFVDACQKAGIPFRTVPALREIITGKVAVSQLREVNLDDLLGREPIQTDLESVERQVQNRTVVVTGAAGSIGAELCRQILQYGPAQLICVDQSETGVFYLQKELEGGNRNGTRITYCVGNVGHRERMLGLFSEHRPQVVFHAAAYKHVPIMELNVCEALRNNVFGLLCLLDVAEATGVKDFVLISSDKAVNPTSVMGATKRISELILSCKPANGMRCVSVRFGNVLGSNGSVVPVLRDQLLQGKPLTITHPEIKRYFMTTTEAVALVLQAFAIGDHGDILVLDMGEPIKIVELARNLARLSGKSDEEISFQFIGLREGEKLHEELFYQSEEIITTPFQKIKRTRNDLNGWEVLQGRLKQLYDALGADGPDLIRQRIRDIVPEYHCASAQASIRPGSRKERPLVRGAASHD